MDALPSELALNIAGFLNPSDRWRLSATGRRYRDLLPVWLRIKIFSPSSHSTLQNNFYVSPAMTPHQPLLHRPTLDGEATDGHSFLQYGVEYLFWTYDYERENQVFLGRHGQKLLYHEDPQYIYTMGLRPVEPNQTWKVVAHTGMGPLANNNKDVVADAAASCEGQPVPYGSPICLTVAGQDPKPYRPDSSTRLYLSAHNLSSGSLWYSIHDKEWCADEELHILPSAEFPYLNGSTTTGNSETVTLESERTTTSSDGDVAEGQSLQNIGFISERELVIHAIPDILDGGYSLYSPQSLKQGEAACMLHHVTIPCYFWIQDGLMIFQAFQSLKFKFGVPILEEDLVDPGASQVAPLEILLAKNSSRWWAIKHYMSNAVDVEEGKTVNMEVFLRNSKDHEDHTIVYDKEKELVYIVVQDAVVETKFPDVPWNKDAVWKFDCTISIA